MKENVVNSRFYETSKALVIRAIDLFRSHRYDQDKEEEKTARSCSNNVDRASSKDGEPFPPSPADLIKKHIDDFSKLPEMVSWLEVIKKDRQISRQIDKLIGTQRSLIRPRMFVWDILFRLLRTQLNVSPCNFEFIPALFDQTYVELERFLYSDFIELKVFAPLFDFTSDMDEIDLGKDLKIRKIVGPDFTSRDFLKLQNIGADDPRFPSYLAEISCKVRKTIWDDNLSMPASGDRGDRSRPDEKDELNRLLTALRIFKPSIVYYGVAEAVPATDMLPPYIVEGSLAHHQYTERQPIRDGVGFRVGMEIFHARHDLEKSWSSFLPYVLNASEIADFRKLWSTIKGIDLEKNASLGIAIDRFNYGCERERMEDKLIDYFIAFEALLLRESDAELSYRLSVRVARLLNQKFEDRKSTMDKMKELYGLRSRIVHGDVRDVTPAKVFEVERLLKESMKRLFEELQERKYEETLSRLDLGED